MKKIISFILLSSLLLLSLTGCSSLQYGEETKYSQKLNPSLKESYARNLVNYEESKQEDKVEYLLRTSGVWHNTEDNNNVIEMTDNLNFAHFPNIQDKSAFITGIMDIKSGNKALEELHISEAEIPEGLKAEDYYSVIVSIAQYTTQGYDVSEKLDENSKIWYMIIFYSDDYIFVYDANNDKAMTYQKQ